jgi:hypothetical protein
MVVIGAIVTAIFDAVTNLATGILFGQIRATLMAGLAFSAWHVATNALLFGLVGAPLLGALEPYRSRLSS